MAMMILPRIDDPVPLTFIPDVQFGEADGKPLLLDVIAPRDVSAASWPAVIWVHGFGWFAGTRRDNLEISLCAFLATQGFFTVSIEYRLSDEATFPVQIHDVKAAIRWLRANAAAYSIDPDHIGIWGGSAGGHLAALAGVTGDLPELEGTSGSAGYSSRVQAVVLASAPSDFLHPGETCLMVSTPRITRSRGSSAAPWPSTRT
ncbi:MAG TPA: alpha/beta hydrolase [Chloroflexota bacterium]|nr:alpha/beta hydrolase [Chloroflexota bacterium]